MPTDDEYLAKAAEALEQLKDAKSESERVRLRRANAAYLRLSTHKAEAAVRAEMKPPPAPRSEKKAHETAALRAGALTQRR